MVLWGVVRVLAFVARGLLPWTRYHGTVVINGVWLLVTGWAVAHLFFPRPPVMFVFGYHSFIMYLIGRVIFLFSTKC